jgi:hypothetical protein
MLTREELLSEGWKYTSFKDARDFALKMSNYYDLQNLIEKITDTKYLVTFSEQDNG